MVLEWRTNFSNTPSRLVIFYLQLNLITSISIRPMIYNLQPMLFECVQYCDKAHFIPNKQ